MYLFLGVQWMTLQRDLQRNADRQICVTIWLPPPSCNVGNSYQSPHKPEKPFDIIKCNNSTLRNAPC